jgi:hypothetical protein
MRTRKTDLIDLLPPHPTGTAGRKQEEWIDDPVFRLPESSTPIVHS